MLKILSGNKILVQIKGHNSGKIVGKMSCDSTNVKLVNINAYIKLGEILTIDSQDIELKQNFGINQGP